MATLTRLFYRFLYFRSTIGLRETLKKTFCFLFQKLKTYPSIADNTIYQAPFKIHNVLDTEIFEDAVNYGRKNKPLLSAPLVWYTPNWLYWWGGGILTILRFAYYLRKKGLNNILYIYNNEGYPTLRKLQADLDEVYHGHNISITTNINTIPTGHIAIATTHQSVFSVLNSPRKCAERFYFMQEYESLLYPGGTQAEQANATYKLGFKGICGGDWLKSLFQSYGGQAIKFDFSVDKDIFFYNKQFHDKVTKLFFFGRPSSDRRMYDLGIAILESIHNDYPNVEIVIAGLDNLAKVPFPATYLGNVKIKDTGSIYRTCDIGIALSGSNQSYLPVELMACGVPVLTNNGPQVDWFCKHMENAYTCYPFVSDFKRGFDVLYNSKELRKKLINGGLKTIQRTSWENEANKIYDFIIKSYQ